MIGPDTQPYAHEAASARRGLAYGAVLSAALWVIVAVLAVALILEPAGTLAALTLTALAVAATR